MKQITVDVAESGKTYILLIGNNKYENVDIIKNSSQEDVWFHLDNIPGPHFVLQTGGDILPKRYINYIGTLFRDYKNGLPAKYTVIYTEVRNVKLTNEVGTVISKKLRYINY